jgi:hypothetical protein
VATLGRRYLKISLIYFAITIIIGSIFSIKPIHDLITMSNYMAEFHSHMSLIGWVSMAILGLIYCYLEDKGIAYDQEMGSKGFLFIAIGSILMPIMLLLTGIIRITTIIKGGIMTNSPMVELVIISAIIIGIGAFIAIINIYKVIDK